MSVRQAGGKWIALRAVTSKSGSTRKGTSIERLVPLSALSLHFHWHMALGVDGQDNKNNINNISCFGGFCS